MINNIKDLLMENARINKDRPFNKHSKIDHLIPVSNELRTKINALNEDDLFNLMICTSGEIGNISRHEIYYKIEIVTQYYNSLK